jgi:hypothetical protein
LLLNESDHHAAVQRLTIENTKDTGVIATFVSVQFGLIISSVLDFGAPLTEPAGKSLAKILPN